MMHSLSRTTAARRSRQAGFTLVEIAIGLALIGILAAMVLKSTEVVEQYRQGEFVTQVRTLEANLKAYRTTYGRWPGDCNRDGLIDYGFLNVATLETTESYDYVVPASLAAASDASAGYTAGATCPVSSLAPWPHLNVPYNELKLGGQMRAGEPNRKAAGLGAGSFAFLGTFTINPGIAATEAGFNAIVLTRVPIATARRLAVAIDGSDSSASNLNRVRRTEDLVSFAPLWTAEGETEMKLITVAIFFDRVPPAGN